MTLHGKRLHYYPFGMPMPGRSLNKQICTDVSQATLVTDLDNTFTGSTEGYSGIASTLSAGGNALLVTKNSGTHTFGTSKTFTITQSGTNHMLGFEVTQFAVGTNISVLCKIDGNTVATITGITSQSISIGTLSTGNHTLSFETNGPIGGNRSFTIDNIEIIYDVTTITTTCVDAVDYRYGFNGQEKDDEVSGKGNTIVFKYRVHDPRLGRFLSIDPLSTTYPFYTPYQFAGNIPIWMIDLEGAEPALPALNYNQNLVFGNQTTVNAVNNHPSFHNNVNWNAYPANSIFDVQIKVQDIKSMGGKINNVYIQTHGLSAKIKLDFGMSEIGFSASPLLIDVSTVDAYNKYQGLSGEERSKFFDNSEDPFLENKFEFLGALDEVMNSMEDGGTLILGGCFSANCREDTGDLNAALKRMSGGRVNIYMNQDGTHVNKKGEQFLDSPLTKERNFLKGWKKNGQPTGRDLQLNSGGAEVEDVETH